MILDLKESSVSRKIKLCNKKSCHVNLTCTQLQQCKGKMKVLDGDRCILVQDAKKLFSVSKKCHKFVKIWMYLDSSWCIDIFKF
jgi:hypothetical protein